MVTRRAQHDRSSSPDRGEERFDTDDVHYAREVVGEHVQRHLSRYLRQRLHQKVRRTHPHLQRSKRMLDRLTTSTHCIRISVQARLHSINNILVLPPLDATLRSLRALSLQRAGAARVGPTNPFSSFVKWWVSFSPVGQT